MTGRELDAVDQTVVRSRALDAICAFGVTAAGADLAVVTRLVDGQHAVIGRHGSLVEGQSPLPDGDVPLEEMLKGAAAMQALTVVVGGQSAGLVLLARREGAFGLIDRTILYRLRQVAEAQMAAEGMLAEVARAAFHRIESARAL